MEKDISKIGFEIISIRTIPRGKVKNDIPHYGLKEHASVDVTNGFVLATELTPASHHDSPYLPLCAAASCHTDQPIKIIYADKGYFGEPNRSFLSLNQIKDGIMAPPWRGWICSMCMQ